MNDFTQERLAAFQQKKLIDAEIGTIKGQLGRAKDRARLSREHMPREEYRALWDTLHRLQDESQAMQARITELRAAERQANIAENERIRVEGAARKQRNIQLSNERNHRFIKALQQLLRARMPEAEYKALITEASALADQGDAG